MLKPRPLRPWLRAAILPLSIFDAVKMMSSAVVIGAIAAILMNDALPLFLGIALGYTCILTFGRHFAEYKVDIPNRRYFDRAVILLNETREFEKSGENMWIRRRMFRVLNSDTDGVRIISCGTHWTACGRRFYIFSLASALNKRAAEDNL